MTTPRCEPSRFPQATECRRWGRNVAHGRGSAATGRGAALAPVGLDLGLTLDRHSRDVGDGAAEELVADAIDGAARRCVPRQQGLPSNAGRKRHDAGVRAEPNRLRTDRIDLTSCTGAGTFRSRDRRGVHGAEGGGQDPALGRQQLRRRRPRRPDRRRGRRRSRSRPGALQPAAPPGRVQGVPMVPRRSVPTMAYSPVDRGALVETTSSARSPRSMAPRPHRLRWRGCSGTTTCVRSPRPRRPSTCAKTRDALELQLDSDDLELLDEIFPPPRRAAPLDLD